MRMSKRTFAAFALLTAILLSMVSAAFAQGATPESGYASVNGMEMYYEVHGTGEPLVVLHGGYMSLNTLSDIITRFAETRQVIAPELQGHGRTADIDRPLTYENLADDVAALLDELGIEQADIFGYSMGGNTALQLALRHPEKVRKLVLVSANYNHEGIYPEILGMMDMMSPEMFTGTPILDDYNALAPHPENFAALVEKVAALDRDMTQIAPEALEALTAPTFVIIGDSDSVPPAHAVDMFHLRGGGVNGDLSGLPAAQLAVLPATTHISILFRADWLTMLTNEFLAAPMPA
jgi:pimeloyl-ACP methyl ester carboxylesterase